MTFMPWNEEFAVGIQEIDEQHHWLLDRTNELYDCLAESEPDHQQIADLLEGLVDYTMNHFIVEEELFQRFGYPEAVSHKALHDAFSARIMELLHRHEAGDVSGVETLDVLVNWLLNHIVKVDREYVGFLQQHGIA